MKRIILLASLFSGYAFAAPDEIHTCLAWFTVYEQNHMYDRRTSILKSQLELEMKRDKIYNANQIKEAMADKELVSVASKSIRETRTTLSYCTKISSDFIR